MLHPAEIIVSHISCRFFVATLSIVLMMGAEPALAQNDPSKDSSTAHAFPNRTVRIVVPFAPGGVSSMLARELSARMDEVLGQSVVVENRPGGSGQIAAQEVLRSPADGHVLLMGDITTHAINAHIFPQLTYSPDKDFIPVTLLATMPNLLVVHPSVPAQNVGELVALAKSKPGSLSYASPGRGSAGHLAGELFKSLADISMVHIPYKGAAFAVLDLVSGRVQVFFNILSLAHPLAKEGKIRPLAVTSLNRNPATPEIPTMAESGFPGWDTGAWFGIFVRAGTPEAVINKIHAETTKALRATDFRERFAAQGGILVGSSRAEFAAFVAAESARWGKVVRERGIQNN